MVSHVTLIMMITLSHLSLSLYRSSTFVDFIRQCLQKDPALRPTSHLMLQHDFIGLHREDSLFKLVKRSKAVVRELDDMNYRRARKILMMKGTGDDDKVSGRVCGVGQVHC